MDENELTLKNISAHLCAIECAVAALIAVQKEQVLLGKYLDSAATAMLNSPYLSSQPERIYFQRCLDRLREAVDKQPVRKG